MKRITVLVFMVTFAFGAAVLLHDAWALAGYGQDGQGESSDGVTGTSIDRSTSTPSTDGSSGGAYRAPEETDNGASDSSSTDATGLPEGAIFTTDTGTGGEGISGGATGGAVPGDATMQFSYDQRDRFIKTERTKLDSLKKRIDMLDENTRKAPQETNAALKPKVAELYGMSNALEERLDRVQTSSRDEWDTTKSDIEKRLTDLEKALVDAEAMFR